VSDDGSIDYPRPLISPLQFLDDELSLITKLVTAMRSRPGLQRTETTAQDSGRT
jgi:hypothetical protein